MIKILSLTQHLKDNKYEAFSSQSVGAESLILHGKKCKTKMLRTRHLGRKRCLSFRSGSFIWASFVTPPAIAEIFLQSDMFH